MVLAWVALGLAIRIRFRIWSPEPDSRPFTEALLYFFLAVALCPRLFGQLDSLLVRHHFPSHLLELLSNCLVVIGSWAIAAMAAHAAGQPTHWRQRLPPIPVVVIMVTVYALSPHRHDAPRNVFRPWQAPHSLWVANGVGAVLYVVVYSATIVHAAIRVLVLMRSIRHAIFPTALRRTFIPLTVAAILTIGYGLITAALIWIPAIAPIPGLHTTLLAVLWLLATVALTLLALAGITATSQPRIIIRLDNRSPR